MAMFVNVYPDRFTEVEKTVESRHEMMQLQGRDDKRTVRRPTRGIVLKKDTYATLRVVASNGKPIDVIDAGSRRKDSSGGHKRIDGSKIATDVYSNFLLQLVQEERMEKQQILETFGEPYIFFFGERARVISFQGVLLNTHDFNWEAEWWENYERFLRGTKCVENDARVFLSFDDTLISGYIIGCAASKNSTDRNHVTLQFQMFITSYTNLSFVGNPDLLRPGETPIRSQNTIDRFYRPVLLASSISGRVQNGSINQNEVSWQDSLASKALAVSRVLKTASSLTNLVLRKASQLFRGEVVRVPAGFAGSLVFDDPAVETTNIFDAAAPVRYGHFDLNDDEYVGESSHYGSSQVGLTSALFFEDPVKKAKRREGMVSLAREQWAAAGLEIPNDQLGPVATMLAGKGLGLIAAGATSAWQKGSLREGGNSVVNGLLNLTGVSNLANEGTLATDSRTFSNAIGRWIR